MSNNSMTKILDKVKFLDKVKILPGGISNSPTYSLQRSVSPVEGGGSSITFTVNTTNVADGTSLPYTISNISPADVTSGSLTGSFTVASNTASTTLGVSLEPTSPGVGSASLALNNGAASISVFPAPTYSLTRSVASVDEGSSITFTLTTTGVANGTNVPYTISGISEGDLSSGSLSGNFVINNGSAEVTITLAADALTDGSETISITAAGQSSSASVNDTSLNPPPSPTYTLTRSAASVNEGSSVTFTLTTTNVANGTSIPYSISGISAEDLSSGSLSGNFVINNGSATVTLTAASDALTEGTETITITAASQSTTTSIVDNSFNPVTGPAETVLLLDANETPIVDGANKNSAISFNGTAAITTSISKHGTGSLTLSSDGDYIEITNNSNIFAFGTSDFTIEAWVYHFPNNWTAETYILDTRVRDPYDHNGVAVLIRTDNTVGWGTISSSLHSNLSATPNQWNHIAATRHNGVINIFVNGIKSNNFTNINSPSNTNFTANKCRIGCNYYHVGANQFKGHIDDLRITKNLARYTSNFTPPTGPLTIDI